MMASSEMWLARAAQARRIADMLSPEDARILHDFAEECEAEARRLIEMPAAA